MKLFSDIGNGLAAYPKAIGLIFSNGLWWYFLFPILLNILFFAGGFYGIGVLTEAAQDWLTTLLESDSDTFLGFAFLKDVGLYIQKIASGFLWIFLKIIFFFIFATFGGYIVIICLSPIFAILSEKTEEILTGKKYPFNADQLMRDIVRGVLIAFRNVFIETLFIILFFILSFIPIIGQVAAIIMFFISAYFYGFSFIDYYLERQKYNLKQSVRFMRLNKGVAIANGSIFALVMFIPFCGITLAGFVAIVSVVAATISTHKVINNQSIQNI